MKRVLAIFLLIFFLGGTVSATCSSNPPCCLPCGCAGEPACGGAGTPGTPTNFTLTADLTKMGYLSASFTQGSGTVTYDVIDWGPISGNYIAEYNPGSTFTSYSCIGCAGQGPTVYAVVSACNTNGCSNYTSPASAASRIDQEPSRGGSFLHWWLFELFAYLGFSPCNLARTFDTWRFTKNPRKLRSE